MSKLKTDWQIIAKYKYLPVVTLVKTHMQLPPVGTTVFLFEEIEKVLWRRVGISEDTKWWVMVSLSRHRYYDTSM